MRVNPLTGGTSFGGREGRKARRKQAIKNKKIGDRVLGVERKPKYYFFDEFVKGGNND